ncbi:hypothetical protein JZ751_014883, partial [Albula glossodonta]
MLLKTLLFSGSVIVVTVMGLKVFGVFLIFLIVSLPLRARYLKIKKRDWIDNSEPNLREGDVECFTEYMELWIHRMRIEGLRLWLSGTLRIPVSLAALDHLNLQLSVCGFSLHRDPERNFIFRVMYSGCFVQTELHWSLALRGKLVVALEDASLIQLNTEINSSIITVQGKRKDIMSSEMVMEKSEEFLPLKLVSSHYAYSMEASCPRVSSSPAEETVLHIFKRRMGLTKRGGYDKETFSLSDVSVSQTDTFSVSESADFVQLTIPTSHILHMKTPEDHSSLLLSSGAVVSTSHFHTIVLPPMYLTPIQKLSADTVTRETPSTSPLLSSGQATGGSDVTMLITETLTGVAALSTQGNVSHGTSVIPRSTSPAPPPISRSPSTPVTPALHPPPQLQSGPPASGTRSASPQTVEGVRPTQSNLRTTRILIPEREITGWAGSSSAPPLSSRVSLRSSLSVGLTKRVSQEGEGAFSVSLLDIEREENSTAEEQRLAFLNRSESTWDPPSGMHRHMWEDVHPPGRQQLIKSSVAPLIYAPLDEMDQEVITTPPALPSHLPLTLSAHEAEGARAAAVEDDNDSKQTRGIASPSTAASGQRLSSDVQASSFINTSQSDMPESGAASRPRTPAAGGQIVSVAPLAPLNSSDSLQSSAPAL